MTDYTIPNRQPKNVVKELCRLRSLVRREVIGHDEACDCLCSYVTNEGSERAAHDFRDEGGVAAFIRAAVVEKIAAVKQGRLRRTTIVRPVP